MVQEQQKPPLHLRYLDSVRGMAALCVVVYHYLNWNYKDKMPVKVANIFINGADAVSFFFVLSGFVLSYKYIVLGHRLDVGKFYINRFFRLWPAFFVTVFINALYHNWDAMGGQQLIELFILNKHKFWQEAAMIRYNQFTYYAPGWTLVAEFILSMFVPYLIILALYSKKVIWWFAAFILLMCTNMAGLGMFLNHFVYGVLIAASYYFITSEGFKTSKWFRYRYLWVLAGFILLSMRPIEKLYAMGWFYDEVIYKYFGYDVFYFSGLGAFIILAFIIQNRSLQKMLELGLLRFLGKISFGIYLMHWLPVTYIFNNWDRLASYFPDFNTAFISIFIAYLAVTIALAAVCYYFIELPFIRWSKKITSKMKPTLVIEPGKEGAAKY
jgi:peptidoglycan/LPS O-acetylase OafA/YrhL